MVSRAGVDFSSAWFDWFVKTRPVENAYLKGSADGVLSWSPVSAPSGSKGFAYIVYVDGSTYYAVDGSTGVVGSSGTNAATVINYAITAVNAAGGGVVFVKHGNYTILSTISLLSNVALIGENRPTLTFAPPGTDVMFERLDSWGASQALTANLVAGDHHADVTDGTAFAAGDWVKVVSDETITALKAGEYFQVASVAVNVVNFTAEAYHGFATADNAVIAKATLCDNAEISGFEIVGPGISTDSSGSQLFGMYHFRFRNNYVHDWGVRALLLVDCIDTIVEGNAFENNFLAGTGYSVSVGNASFDTRILNNTFRRLGRHYVTAGGTGSGAFQGGWVKNMFIEGNTFYATDTAQEAINTHAPTLGPFVVNNNHFYGCGYGVETIDCELVCTNNYFIMCEMGVYIDAEDWECTHLIANNVFQDCSNSGVRVKSAYGATILNNVFDNAKVVYDDTDVANVHIKGNTFKNIGASDSISFTGAVGAHVSHISIVGNTFTDCSSGGTYIIRLQYVDNALISGNYMSGCGTFLLSTCEEFTISNNIMVDSAAICVRVMDDCKHFSIVGNHLDAPGVHGISLEPDNTQGDVVVIHSNYLSDTTTIANDSPYYTNIYGSPPGGMSSLYLNPVMTASRVQNGQPVLVNNGDVCIWEDADGGPLRYIVVRVNGADYKVAVA